MLECICVDARFGEIERGAISFMVMSSVVVKDNNEPFVAIEAACDEPHQIAVLQTMRRILGFLVLENIDLADISCSCRSHTTSC